MTTLEAEDIMYVYLAGSSLKTAIESTGGAIYKVSKPINHQGEAVEIKALTVNNESLAEGMVNVNIHVPNKTVNVNDVQDDTQPNHARLKELALIAKGLLKDGFIGSQDFGFEITNQLMFSDDVSKAHYINFRVRIYSINLN